MSETITPKSPQTNYKTYVLPELGVAVEARSVEEAVTKGIKKAKEN